MCNRHYKVGNPFEWMETISLQGKMNFFEKQVGEYSKLGSTLTLWINPLPLMLVSETKME